MSHDESFFLQCLFNIKKVGAVAPSSKSLARKMIKQARVEDARFIAEFGAGTGSITRQILAAMHPQAQLLVFEPHTPFYKKLEQIHDDRIHLFQAPAQELSHHLAKKGFPNLDCVFSGIPLTNLSKKIQQEIIGAAYSELKAQGRFVQFQYSLLSRKHIKNIFGNVTTSFVPWNLPPAAVYTSIKN